MIIGQLGKLLGLNISAENPLSELVEVIGEIDEISWATFAVGAVCLSVLLLSGWLFPKLPAPLFVVVLAIVISAVVGLASEGCRGGRRDPGRLAQPRSA